jgi:hypothetical protein
MPRDKMPRDRMPRDERDYDDFMDRRERPRGMSRSPPPRRMSDRDMSVERRRRELERDMRERERRLEERERRLEDERRYGNESGDTHRQLSNGNIPRDERQVSLRGGSPIRNGNSDPTGIKREVNGDDGPIIKQIVELRKEDYDKLLEYKEKCRELIIENEVLTDKYKKVLELSSAKLRDEMRMKKDKRPTSPIRDDNRGRLRSRSRSISRDRDGPLDEYRRSNVKRNHMIASNDRTRRESSGLQDFTPPRNRRSMSRSRSPARVRSRRNSLTLSEGY